MTFLITQHLHIKLSVAGSNRFDCSTANLFDVENCIANDRRAVLSRKEIARAV